MNIKRIYTPFFYILENKDIKLDVYYYNADKNEIKKIDKFKKENKFNKISRKYTASRDGYYILNSQNTFRVIVKGKTKYCAFLRSKSNKNTIKIEAFFINGESEQKVFNKIFDNIYVCDLSNELRIGWLGKNKIFPINKDSFVNSNKTILVSKENSNGIKETVNSNKIKRNYIQSSTKHDKITSKVSKNNVHSVSKKRTVESDIKKNQ